LENVRPLPVCIDIEKFFSLDTQSKRGQRHAAGKLRPYRSDVCERSCRKRRRPASLPDNWQTMNTVLSPIESEFATVEEAEAYDRWFRAKVQASLDDQLPSTPHDQVMATLREIIEAKRRAHASDSVAR
jgi:hypothetical protein